MFITRKRHEREKQISIASSNRLTEAILQSSTHGLFLLDHNGRIQLPVSKSLARMFRRQDFTRLSFENLLGPVVSAKTLSAARIYVASLLEPEQVQDAEDTKLLQDMEIRLTNVDGTQDTAHYSFEFNPIDRPGEPRVWMVRVTDSTARAQENRELEDLRGRLQTQGEILRSVLHGGGARFGAFLQRTDASMQTIHGVLKKPAREADVFRHKLEETLEEVDRVRRDAAALKLTGLEAAARHFEDSLQDLRSRGALSGSDFLPLAVKLDQLYGQFAAIRQITLQATPACEPNAAAPDARVTDNGTQIIEAPKFFAAMAQPAAIQGAHRVAQAGSLESTLSTLTELAAHEQQKMVRLRCAGIQLVPPRYQAAVKNVAIQLIRNAVMHGIESPPQRSRAGKPPHGSLLLEFKTLADESFELHFQDDGCGLDADTVRTVAVARGVISAEAAGKLRDRQAIKLIFKSGFTTLASAPGAPPHGAGMALVRRYVNEAGGKIALASLAGHETRFKVTLPPLAAAAAPSASRVA